jgi:hypothetical protein
MVRLENIQQIIPRILDWKDMQEIQIKRIGGLRNENDRITVDGFDNLVINRNLFKHDIHELQNLIQESWMTTAMDDFVLKFWR